MASKNIADRKRKSTNDFAKYSKQVYPKMLRTRKFGVYQTAFETWPNKPKFDVWIQIPLCSRKRCPAFRDCKNIDPYTDECVYIRSCLTKILKNIELFWQPEIPQEVLMRIGAELIPMYLDLLRLNVYLFGKRTNIEEVEDIVSTKGNMKLHWAYAERKTLLQMIGRFWRECGVRVISPPPGAGKAVSEDGSAKNVRSGKTVVMETEDDDEPIGSYEKMEQDIQREKALIKEREKANGSS